MCRPTFYGVSYEINPWMDIRRQPDRARAIRQWEALRRTLVEEVRAEVFLVPARPHLPDMTFTANAGLVYRGVFIPSRFRYKERAGEERHFTNWFRRHGFRIAPLPAGQRFEGAGDALFVGRDLVIGYYWRTDIAAHESIGAALNVRTLVVELVNQNFYHLDTCFAPFSPTSAIFYPKAFDCYGRQVLAQHVPDLIPVTDHEAYRFACNSIFVGRKAVIPQGAPGLARLLRKRGYTVYALDLSEYLKAGGSAKCLTIRIR